MRSINTHGQQPPLKYFLPPRYSKIVAWGNKISQITGSLISFFKPNLAEKSEPSSFDERTRIESEKKMMDDKPVEVERKMKSDIKGAKKKSKMIPYKEIESDSDANQDNLHNKSHAGIQEQSQRIMPQQKGSRVLHQITIHSRTNQNLKKRGKYLQENSLENWKKKLERLKYDHQEEQVQNEEDYEDQVSESQGRQSQTLKSTQKYEVRFIKQKDNQQNKGRKRSKFYEKLHAKQIEIINELQKQLPLIEKKFQQLTQKERGSLEKSKKENEKNQSLEEKLLAINNRLQSNQRQTKKKSRKVFEETVKTSVPQISFSLDKLLDLLKREKKQDEIKESLTATNNVIRSENPLFGNFGQFSKPEVKSTLQNADEDKKIEEKKASFGFGIPSLIPRNGSFISKEDEAPKVGLFGNLEFGVQKKAENVDKPAEVKQASQNEDQKKNEVVQKPKQEQKKQQPKGPLKPEEKQKESEDKGSQVSKQKQPAPVLPSSNPFLTNSSPQKNLLNSVIGSYTGTNSLFNLKFNQKTSSLFQNTATPAVPIAPVPLSQIQKKQSEISNSVFSTPKKNVNESVADNAQVGIQQNQGIDQNDQSSMFDESEHSVRRDIDSSPYNGNQPSYSNTNSFQSGFGVNNFTNPANIFMNAPSDLLKAIPQVNIQKSMSMFGVNQQDSASLWGAQNDDKKKLDNSFKRKGKQKKTYIS